MSDAPHTIPDHLAARVARLINEAEDMRQQAADDLKQIYADLREELRGMGWVGSVVSAEVAALKGAIAEIRLDDEKKAKREEKGERVGDYVSLLSRARAREGLSYSEAKGREPAPLNASVSKTSSVEMAATPATSFDPETGELTDTQESDQPDEAVAPATAAVASDEMAAQDDVGATASSTHSAHKPAGDLAADNGDKDRGLFPVGGPVHSHSPAAIPLGAANSAGEAPSFSPASPARHSDDIDLTIPEFLRRTEGGYPKREAEEA